MAKKEIDDAAIALKKEKERVRLGGCPRTNMPVSGYQYIVLF